MKYMVIEDYRRSSPAQIYQRFHERGRMLPPGLRYLDSWIETGMQRCFQLMECEDAALLETWTACWDDLVDFEIVEVVDSQTAAGRFAEI
jgi:hypothetical protein